MNLTPSQQNGLNRILFGQGHAIICGAAGTGKTYLMRAVIENLHGNVVFCALTHQAKNVLSDMIGCEAKTIHSVLRIHPHTYEDQVFFDASDDLDLSEVDYLVIDEISMIDNELFAIMMGSIPERCRILGMGDPYQVQPVDHDDGKLSPIFFDPRFENIILEEIVRQSADNPLIKVATDIRLNGTSVYELNDGEIGTFQIRNRLEYFKKYFSIVKTPEDTLTNKVVAYSNTVVDNVNAFVRRKLYNTTEEIVEGEYLVCQSPVKRKARHGSTTREETVFTNGETIQVISVIEKTYIHLSLDMVPTDPPKIEYYRVKVRSIFTDAEFVINIIPDPSYWDVYENYMSDAADFYRQVKYTMPHVNMKSRWKKFWDMKEFFSNIKGSAACTIHKSQGSTFENVFFMSNDIEYASPSVRRQLRYVAVTRSKKNVYFN